MQSWGQTQQGRGPEALQVRDRGCPRGGGGSGQDEGGGRPSVLGRGTQMWSGETGVTHA